MLNIVQYHSDMPIEMMRKQIRFKREKFTDNARLFEGIIIGYSFFQTPVCV